MPLSHAQQILHRAVQQINSGRKKMTVHDIIVAAKRQAESEKRKKDPMYKFFIESKTLEKKLESTDNAPLRCAPITQFREFPAKSKKLRDLSPYVSSSEDEASEDEEAADDDTLIKRPTVEIKRDPEQMAQRLLDLEEGRRRLAAARDRILHPGAEDKQADSPAVARPEVPQGPRAQRSAAPPATSGRPASLDQGSSASEREKKLNDMLLAARRANAGGRLGQDELVVANQSANASAESVRMRVLQELFDLYLPLNAASYRADA